MTYLQAVILALVEGLTEFLPVSSTANILLADKLLGGVLNRDLFASFSIFIQLGAMLAVLGIFFKQLWQNKDIWWKIILAFIPTGLFGLVFYPYVKDYLQDASPLTGWMLIIGGVLFTALDYFWSNPKHRPTLSKENKVNLVAADLINDENEQAYIQTVKKAPWWKMMTIGAGQAVAMVPGVSRSAASIFTARALGFSKFAATQFSFILALPTIAAASGFDLLKEFLNRDVHVVCDCMVAPCNCPAPPYSVFNGGSDLLLMLFGAAIAFLVAAATCNFFIKVLGKKPFLWWGIYRVAIGILWLYLF